MRRFFPRFVKTIEDLNLWKTMKPIRGGALLGAFVDQRTSVSIASNGSASFAHGLPAAPDICWVLPSVSAATATSYFNYFGLTDATNVTMYNQGTSAGPSLRVTTQRMHSIIR